MESETVTRIDTLLNQLGKTRQDLADYVGVTTAAISSWSRRNSIPSADTALNIADFLGTSIRFLLTGEQENNEPLPQEINSAVKMLQNMDAKKRNLAIKILETIQNS